MSGGVTSPCQCFVARHPLVAEIDAALRAPGADVLALAVRYRIGKTVLYEHRKHLHGRPPGQAEGVSVSPPAPAAPPAPPAPPAESSAEFRGKQLTEGQSPARAQPQEGETKGGMGVPQVHGTTYLSAVEHCAEAISRGVMRPAVLHGIAQKLGLTRDRARQAFHEAARHFRLDMGGLLERQEASIAWVLRQRNEAQAKAEAREKMAEEWRQKERRAHDDAQTLDGEARIAALGEAARMGLVASKYGLEAEKWAAQALSHQKHLDDIQCLIGPKELHLNQYNAGGDAGATFGRFAAALARRFAGRPEVLAELEAAAAEMESAPDEPILVPS